MTLNSFIDRYKGKKVDFDGYYGAQCVDLARQYIKDVWDFEQPRNVKSAKDCLAKWGGMCSDYRMLYKIFKENLRRGDLVVFDGTKNNSHGHIAIYLAHLEDDDILVLEQNGITQNGVELKKRSLQNSLGGLRCCYFGGR